MDNLLNALADLIGVGVDTLRSTVEGLKMTTPQIIETLTRELPAYLLITEIQSTLTAISITSLVALFIAVFMYNFRGSLVKYIFLTFVSSIVLYHSLTIVKVIKTPTVYMIHEGIEMVRSDD